MDEGSKQWHSPEKHKMVIKTLALLGLIAIVLVAILRDRIVNYPQWQVTVTGEGRVSYTPDTATVVMGVQIDRAPSALSALTQLNQKISKIIPAIKEAGVPDADITTQNYSLYANYDYRDGVSYLSGYNANQQLTVKVRDLKQDSYTISTVIDAASKAGANQIQSLTFDVSKLSDLQQEARIKALADARSKATALADAAGVRLGKVVGWYESVISTPGPISYIDGKGGGGAVLSVSPQTPIGAQEIVIDMGVNYRIK